MSPPSACSGGMYPTVPTIVPSRVSRVRSVDIARPSLETVFLAVTGRVYDEDAADDEVVA